jgi:hypothetical protein
MLTFRNCSTFSIIAAEKRSERFVPGAKLHAVVSGYCFLLFNLWRIDANTMLFPLFHNVSYFICGHGNKGKMKKRGGEKR